MLVSLFRHLATYWLHTETRSLETIYPRFKPIRRHLYIFHVSNQLGASCIFPHPKPVRRHLYISTPQPVRRHLYIIICWAHLSNRYRWSIMQHDWEIMQHGWEIPQPCTCWPTGAWLGKGEFIDQSLGCDYQILQLIWCTVGQSCSIGQIMYRGRLPRVKLRISATV